MPQDRNKVVWSEGMTLDPHHFQQLDRHYYGLIRGRIRSVAQHDWGLMQLDINEERLENGEVALTACTGVLPDGLLFDIPATDAPPAPRNLKDYMKATQQYVGVYLAVPAERVNGTNYSPAAASDRRATRFGTDTIRIPDENTGINERDIEVAQPHLQIRFEGEQLENHTTLKLAEVERVGSSFRLRETFVPPSLHIAAASFLMTSTRSLIEVLVSKQHELLGRQRSMLLQRELSPNDLAVFGLLGAVHTALPMLNHYYKRPGAHPEDLFLSLSVLAGQLATYSPDAPWTADHLPTYDHAKTDRLRKRSSGCAPGRL